MPRKSPTDYDRPGEAERFETEHFSGSFGRFLRRADELILDELLPDRTATVLDVGTGSGRLSRYLASQRTAPVVGADASESMLRTAQARANNCGPAFVLADARTLPFPDDCFDYAVALRLLMHLADWRGVVGELCRVARRAVVIDAPARFGAPGVEALFHAATHALSGKATPYITFSSADLAAAFADYGYRVDVVKRRFVLPIKLARSFANSTLPAKLESMLERSGVSGVLGGQLTVRAVPQHANGGGRR